MTDRIIAVIPAKSNSRRVPNKNMRLFNGKPLLYYTIEQALKSRYITDVCVSTESEQIKKFSEECGAKVPELRPQELCGDDVHAVLPIVRMIDVMGGADRYKYCLQLLPSHPLKTAKTIDEIIERSMQKQDTVISLTPFGKTMHHLKTIGSDGRINKLTKDACYNFQTQDFPNLYYQNGAAYCALTETVLKHKSFQYGKPFGYVMNQIEAFDIDTEDDFLIAEKIACLVK